MMVVVFWAERPKPVKHNDNRNIDFLNVVSDMV
jgi:hypothetical protein